MNVFKSSSSSILSLFCWLPFSHPFAFALSSLEIILPNKCVHVFWTTYDKKNQMEKYPFVDNQHLFNITILFTLSNNHVFMPCFRITFVEMRIFYYNNSHGECSVSHSNSFAIYISKTNLKLKWFESFVCGMANQIAMRLKIV